MIELNINNMHELGCNVYRRRPCIAYAVQIAEPFLVVDDNSIILMVGDANDFLVCDVSSQYNHAQIYTATEFHEMFKPEQP